MRYLPRALLAGASGVVVSLLAACGSSGSLLSADQGSTLKAQLNSVSTALAARNCAAALSAAGDLQNSTSSLSGVDPALSNALTQSASTVLADVHQTCPASSTSTPAQTTSTASTPTTTQTTTSTPTVSTQTQSTPTTTAAPPTPTTTIPAPATTTTGTGTTSTGSGGAGIGGATGGSGNGSGGGGGY